MKSNCTSYSSYLQRVKRSTRLVSNSCGARRRLTHLTWRSRQIILCTVSQWMPVSHEISRYNRCIFGLFSWLNTRSSTFSVFSLTHTERGLPLPSCRSIVPALRIIFNRVKILPHFEHLLWACLTDTWTERTYVWIKYCLTLFIHKTICCLRRNWSFFVFCDFAR